MGLTHVSGPLVELLTLADVKAQLNMTADETADDWLLLRFISAARHVAESLTQRTLAPTRWAWAQDAWPRGREILLPRPPFTALVSFVYLDSAGVQQVVDSADYFTATADNGYGKVLLKDGKSWPTARMRPPGWTVTWDAGYATLAAVPDAIVEGMMQLAAHWYANREGVVVGDSGMRVAELPLGIRELFLQAMAH